MKDVDEKDLYYPLKLNGERVLIHRETGAVIDKEIKKGGETDG